MNGTVDQIPAWQRSWSVAREWFIERFGPVAHKPSYWETWQQRFQELPDPTRLMDSVSRSVFEKVIQKHDRQKDEYHTCDSCDWAQWEGPEIDAGITSAYVADCLKDVHYLDEEVELEGFFSDDGKACRWYKGICLNCHSTGYLESVLIVDGEHDLNMVPCPVCDGGKVRGWDE